LSGSVAIVELPQTRYAKSGDVSVAYQVFGRGPPDLVFVPPHVSNVELVWEIPPRAAGMRLLAEFSRVITCAVRVVRAGGVGARPFVAPDGAGVRTGSTGV
jgi:hypothetical protein